jgi:hypothetical protein
MMGFIIVPHSDGTVDALIAVDSIVCVSEYPHYPGCTIYLKHPVQQYIVTTLSLQQIREIIVEAMRGSQEQ